MYFTRCPIYIYIISSSILLIVRNVSCKICRENQNAYVTHRNFLFYHAVREITWKNIVESDRPQMTIWRVCVACWITKAKHTNSEYVTLVVFSLLTWLYERASMLRLYVKVVLIILIL